MKIITRAVLDWDGNVLEEDSYQYDGPIAACKDSGSPPQATDPYTQAAAQYGLSTGTANYNAALNRTGSSNPLGSSGWSVTGYSGSPSGGDSSSGSGNPYGLAGISPGGYFGNGIGFPTTGGGTSSMNGSGAPLYTQSTSLDPQFNSMLEQPINDYNIVGDQGVGQAEQQAEGAAYGQQMGYLAPQEAQQTEQLQSQLANEGATPGSAAATWETGNLGRQQTFSNQQAANSAVQAGQSSLANMAGIGSSELQNELAGRMAPISEFNALSSGSGIGVNASTPDISGAFGQQLQSQTAGYNANVATNNSNTASGAALAAAAIMYY